jgi:hypothetical protein
VADKCPDHLGRDGLTSDRFVGLERLRRRDGFASNAGHGFRLQKVGYMQWSLRQSTFTLLEMRRADLSRVRVGFRSSSPSDG